ncbi:GEVED domain-containing protein [Paracrocinitomix mangrovi]|uniref:GEVED domain-containing protein n=1 Tax=Paracrocinitomix mangrovi TaxID=2862509 RepID=UPI003AB97449
MRGYILNNVDAVTALASEVATGGRLNVNNTITDILANCTITACDQPYNVHASAFVDTTATFEWNGFSTDYLFYIQEGNNPVVEIPVTAQTSISFDTLVACTDYTIWVKGICGSDTSNFSFPYTFTTDGCCTNPALNLDGFGTNELTVSWNSILYASGYELRYKPEGAAEWIDTLIGISSPLNITGLDTCTTYELQIKTICTDSTQGFGNSHLFQTSGCGACYDLTYCDVVGANASLEWIDSIVVGWNTNVSGADNGWLQSTDIISTFKPGLTYPIALKPGYSGTAYTEHFTVWIDFDQNGVFDATDTVFVNETTTTVLQESIYIPTNAVHGITKMRIAMNGTSSPVACPTGSFWGEYEDYCVYIGEDAGFDENQIEFSLYPNPAENILNIICNAEIAETKVFDQSGKLIISMQSNNSKTIDISALSSGFYLLQITTEKGIYVQKFIKE